MKRIQKFLELDEVQANIIKNTETGNQKEGGDDIAISIKGNFSWGFKDKKDDNKDKKKTSKSSEKKQTKNDKNSDKTSQTEEEMQASKKSLKHFMTLKNINMTIKKGEFVCIIGDVGSGKSSMLNACIGDLIHVPQTDIDDFGGLDKEATPEELAAFKKRILLNDAMARAEIKDPPIKLQGTISYVE